MFLPSAVYETLPALYITGGVAAISTINSAVAILSGITLGFAGILIYSLRRKHRLSKAGPRRHY